MDADESTSGDMAVGERDHGAGRLHAGARDVTE
jgi:hypothetical protein